jgi:pimeloyl-ACP methyl ester carboxylesterase
MIRLFKYKGRNINYSDRGRGEVIILLHGYLETSAIWKSFGERLSKRYRVIAIDLPGHGRSDNFNETHTMEFMAGIVDDLAHKLDINKFFLTGHSLGGYVTLAFAELFPSMLSGYCLFHSHPFPDTPEVLKRRKNEISLILSGKKEMIWPEHIRKCYAASNLEKFRDIIQQAGVNASSVSAEAMTGVLRGMMARPSRLAVMESGKIPCLWILGAMDSHISCEQIQSKIHLPRNAKTVILTNSGHMGFIEEEELSLKVMDKFVKKLM